MCNALSPEKAVIWSVLHDLAPTDPSAGLRADYFAHPAYRVWFEAVRALRSDHEDVTVTAIKGVMDAQGQTMRDIDSRALGRMLRIAPPARITGNAQLLSQALVDRHHGRTVHIEKLIN